MTDTTLGQRIAEGRKKLGLSQEAFGDRLGVSRQAASKWESDAAVPEIDKLITMSKLFGVSIGWLLGVEDPESPSSEALSEEQLTAVTELLCRYPTPCPERKSRKLRSAVWAAGLAVSIGLGIAGLFLPQSKPAAQPEGPALQAQIDSLTEKNAQLLTQISELTHQQSEEDEFQSQLLKEQAQQIEALQQLLESSKPTGGNTAPNDTSTPPEILRPSAGILENWTLSPTADTESDTVSLHFVGFTGQQATSAQFVAAMQNHELYTQLCQPITGGYYAELELPALNGYTYYFVYLNDNGSPVQLPLTGHNLSDLNAVMDPDFTFSTRADTPAANGSRSFWLSSPDISLKAPAIINENTDPTWKDLRIVYRCDGEIVEEVALDDYLNGQSPASRQLNFELPTLVFDFQSTAEGSCHSLRLEGSVTANGTEFSFDLPIGYWVMRNGKLKASTEG